LITGHPVLHKGLWKINNENERPTSNIEWEKMKKQNKYQNG